MSQISVEVLGHNYDLCQQASSNLWANTKKGRYGSGLINSNKDPRKVERVGLLGEMAFSILSKLPVDFGYKEGGASYDFILKDGRTVDIKTESKLHDYNCGLIYAISDWGKPIMLRADLYVFCYLKEESKDNKKAVINFLGYCTQDFVTQCSVKPGKAW